MLELDTRKMIAEASAVGSKTAPADGQNAAGGPKPASPKPTTPKPLSPAAIDAAAIPTAPAWSPIVVAGTVRMAELALTVLVGLAVYAAYVVPIEGFAWRYVGATF